jgi:hypothetical protein
MAQTKSRSAQTKSRSKSSSRSGGNTRSKRTNSRSSSNRSTANASRAQSSNGFSASTVAKVAEKAKVPVIAGGAALAGVAGAVVYNRNHRKRGVFGRVKSATPNVKLPKADEAVKAVGKAAGTVAERSRQVGDVASRVQKASDTINKG